MRKLQELKQGDTVYLYRWNNNSKYVEKKIVKETPKYLYIEFKGNDICFRKGDGFLKNYNWASPNRKNNTLVIRNEPLNQLGK